jgi:hypothetical protein
VPHQDLKQYYSDIDVFVTQSAAHGKVVVFDQRILPPAPALVSTAALHVARAAHIYEDCYRAEALWIQAHHETFRALGLLILSRIFNPISEETTVVLSHKYTEIGRLVIRRYPSRTAPSGYLERPASLEYEHTVVERYPWINLHTRIDPHDLPCFFLPVGEWQGDADSMHQDSGTVYGFGSDRGAILLAHFLLDIGLSKAENGIYDLEGEAGNRGCGPLSAEARFILPGSDAWNDTLWGG